MNWDQIMVTRQAKYPSENFVRFVARNYYKAPDRSLIRFLDLGCGAGANSWFLAHEGFHVTAVDGSDAALGSLLHRFEEERFNREDRVIFRKQKIEQFSKDSFPTNYDCILDCNTLCHVEFPPLDALHSALKPDGKLFMIAPAEDTWRGTLEGKGYCRVAAETDLREMLQMFSDITIWKSSYPDQGHNITSWIVEARR